MEFLDYFSWIPAFFSANPLVGALIAVVLIFLLYRRPALVITVLLLGLLAVGVLYVVLTLSSAGVEEKEKLIERSVVPGMETTIDEHER
jgi:hypothetical protein